VTEPRGAGPPPASGRRGRAERGGGIAQGATPGRPRGRPRRAAIARAATRPLAAALALLLGAFAAARGARASTEEFSTLDIVRIDEDDESLLDHLLLRPPRAWRDEWERAPQALRTTQGCLTSGQWFIRTDGRFRSRLGERAELGVIVTQTYTDREGWEFVDLEARFATCWGTLGGTFRPLWDKSRQDFGVFWQTGHDTLPFKLRAAFGVEDMFNNLWAWRQSRVGNASASYKRHPYEPALELGARGGRWRVEAAAKWLTPAVKQETDAYGAAYDRLTTLWGARGRVAAEVAALGCTWEARADNHQASGEERAIPSNGAISPVDSALAAGTVHDRFRRLWSAEAAVRVPIGPALEAELRSLYLGRTQVLRPPGPQGVYGAIERVVSGELTWRATPRLAARFGGAHDRITIGRSGQAPFGAHPTRTESRGWFGLDVRFGDVRLYAIEGIELDPEPYDVWLVHDKGFLGLQAVF
jgi:hypothetical protein